jgi:3-methyl-2-oxobutanoate hydroxymethyltransferase
MSAITLATLNKFKAERKRFSMVTAYDASFAAAAARAGVASVLVGDSLGMVVQGGASTVSVTLEDMAYHTACVARGIAPCGAAAPLIVSDLPLGTYYTPQEAGQNAARLMRAGANAVKLEGGAWLADTVRFLTERGVPVCAHLGLTPQTADMLGGYKVQGRDEAAARRIRDDATLLEAAGARLLVLESLLRAAPRMSPSDAPESEEPYCATASFSSAISSALTDTERDGSCLSNWVMRASNFGRRPRSARGAARRDRGQGRTADEGGQIGIDDLHFQTIVLHLVTSQVTMAPGARCRSSRVERIAAKLLDAERNALLVGVDVENLTARTISPAHTLR